MYRAFQKRTSPDQTTRKGAKSQGHTMTNHPITLPGTPMRSAAILICIDLNRILKNEFGILLLIFLVETENIKPYLYVTYPP